MISPAGFITLAISTSTAFLEYLNMTLDYVFSCFCRLSTLNSGGFVCFFFKSLNNLNISLFLTLCTSQNPLSFLSPSSPLCSHFLSLTPFSFLTVVYTWVCTMIFYGSKKKYTPQNNASSSNSGLEFVVHTVVQCDSYYTTQLKHYLDFQFVI